MTEQESRDAFEDAIVAYTTERRASGKAIDDNGAPLTREALCWKVESGEYGVLMFNAAWWGWQAAMRKTERDSHA